MTVGGWLWRLLLLTDLWIAARSAGNVGCLFSSDLCDFDEQCFDDNAFGRCMGMEGDQYVFDLEAEALERLEGTMRLLFEEGYRWSDNRTQCEIQNILHAERYGLPVDPNLCREILAQNHREVQELASIEFLPNTWNEKSTDYADELFEPRKRRRDKEKEETLNELLESFKELYREDENENDDYPQLLADLETEDDKDAVLPDDEIINNVQELTAQDDQATQWEAFLKDLSSFQRDERLDTKKPGPGYKPPPPPPPLIQHISEMESQSQLKITGDDRNSELPDVWSETGSVVGETKSGPLEVVDGSHTFLSIDSEKPLIPSEGHRIVTELERLLDLPRGTFSNIRVQNNKIIFKVNPNSKNLNASTVAARAEELQSELEKRSGEKIQSAGIGNKNQYEVTKSEIPERSLFVLTFVVCGAVVGVVLGVAIIFLVRRHATSKRKLQELAQQDIEPCQDYQDLCRQRMASGQPHQSESISAARPEPIHVVQSPKRVSSLSQSEPSQPSPSSRSSTSSWSEEPVTSNMDITTGHMILSYMEDHLRTKDKLDKEWEALCAYEAEPCATVAATLEHNRNKNRYPDVLAYDHTRVILNENSNVSGSDYINANAITDHDPRNPAYIATQGPLPHTAADLWQMVWEQGSVVIVMLTRLMENGVAMCHRYWPEEGSELYHIYEVHLVSEHIWCDEYLVRSFYLKNVKTSETRTVTQFHFLAWPDQGVPSSVKALLEFRRKVNKSYRGRSCPIIVHCSDGIGRTGTYCLIDMVLNRVAKGAKEIDIAATLEHIRDQRGGAVKTKAQFEFVLVAIAEEIQAILKALASH